MCSTLHANPRNVTNDAIAVTTKKPLGAPRRELKPATVNRMPPRARSSPYRRDRSFQEVYTPPPMNAIAPGRVWSHDVAPKAGRYFPPTLGPACGRRPDGSFSGAIAVTTITRTAVATQYT